MDYNFLILKICPEKRKGSVLILSLWTLLFLTLIAFACGALARQEAALVGSIEHRAQLYDLAYSGAQAAIDTVYEYYEDREQHMPDALKNKLFDNPGIFKEIALGPGEFSVVYNHSDNLANKDELRYGVLDEERKVNFNFAGKFIIEGVLNMIAGMNPGKAEKLALNIIDWRDNDDLLGNGKYAGTERIDYNNSGIKYYPPNRDFKNLEEILLVKGMDLEIFSAIRDYITVFGSGRVNINTASREVLYSLGLMPQTVDKILSYRSGPDRAEGTADDNTFSSVDEIVDNINSIGKLAQNEKEKLTELVFGNILDIESTTMRAESISSTHGSTTKCSVICVFTRDGHVLYWGSSFIS